MFFSCFKHAENKLSYKPQLPSVIFLQLNAFSRLVLCRFYVLDSRRVRSTVSKGWGKTLPLFPKSVLTFKSFSISTSDKRGCDAMRYGAQAVATRPTRTVSWARTPLGHGSCAYGHDTGHTSTGTMLFAIVVDCCVHCFIVSVHFSQGLQKLSI